MAIALLSASVTKIEAPTRLGATSPQHSVTATTSRPDRGQGHLRSNPEVILLSGRTGSSLVVPILYYHYVRVNPVATDRVGFNLSVTPANFSAQMDALRQHDAHPITPEQLMRALDAGVALPPHPVLLTFDDGYADFATTAEPILRAHGFVAVDYVVSGFIGRPNYMTADQVVAADRAGVVIGCHTLNHVALASADPVAQWTEIAVAKQQLEQLLGHPVLDFAYPYGSYTAMTEALLQRAGFRDAVTTMPGDEQRRAFPFLLQRTEVGGTDTADSVVHKVLLS